MRERTNGRRNEDVVRREKIAERHRPTKWEAPEPRRYRTLAQLATGLTKLHVDLRIVDGEKLPQTGPALVVANHPSHLDPIVLAVVIYRLGRKPRFLGLAELFDKPVAGWAMRTARMIPVVRGAGPERLVHDAVPALEAHQVVIVYPEGQLTRPWEDRPARPGAGLLALRTGAPVIPVASVGLAPERGKRLPKVRRKAAFVFGDPVDLSPWEGREDERDAQIMASAAMLGAVQALLPRAREAAARR
jgi:1-acyl-sn-glycerol-3-phosphate acyltransferase